MYRILITTLLLFLIGCQQDVVIPSQLPQQDKGLVRPVPPVQGSIKNRVALVIGNANYKFAPLNNPVNDARDMAESLRSVGFDVIEKENASWEDMDKAITAFQKKLGKGVVGLFYFSGHGIQIDDQNYLIPVDLPELSVRHVKYRSILAGDVLTAMQQSNNSMNIVILDACRDNPFKSLGKGMKKGLARSEKVPSGTLIAYATSPGDTAADGNGRNSPYTAGLLAYLHKPNLPIELMFKRVRNTVKKKTNNRQTPWESSSLDGDDFYFVEKKTVVASTSDTPPVVPVAPVVPIPSNTGAEDADKVFRDTLIDGSQGPEMVRIPAGSFRMGDIQGGGQDDEKPVHRVSVGAFAMGKYEVTVGEYLRFVNATGKHAPEWMEKGSKYNIKTGTDDYYKKFGSALTNKTYPIVGVSWHDATAYAKWLSQQTGHTYRLPTEAEWEYAARAGTTTKYWWGNKIGTNKANCSNSYCKDSYKYTAPVGSFKANPFGLHDTVGNVWEWCSDIYSSDYYSNSPRSNPTGPGGGETGRYRVRRGGAWDGGAQYARSAVRYNYSPGYRSYYVGFRLLRQP